MQQQNDFLYFNTALTLLPGCVYWKNADGVYLDGNLYLKKQMAAKGFSIASIIGQADEDVFSRECAELIRRNDMEIMRKNTHIIRQENITFPNGELFVFISSKRTILDQNGDVCGLVGMSLDTTKHERVSRMHRYREWIAERNHGVDEILNAKLWLSQQWENTYLTFREAQCAYYLYQGKTIRKVAAILNVSSRTVETHVNNLKIKIGCRKKSDLIEILYSSGMLDDIINFIF